MDFLFKKYSNKIGIAKIGGVGDTIQLLFLSHAIRRKYPDSEITIYVRDKNEYIKRDTKIDRIIFTGYCDWNELVKKEALKYNLFFDDRYYVGVWRDGKLENNYNGKYWEFFNHLNKLNANVLQMAAKNVGVKLIKSDYDLRDLIYNNKLEQISNKYILIHNDDSEVRRLKSYPLHYWDKIINYIVPSHPDLNIIQIGTGQESRIKNTIDLRGKLNFEELCSLVRGAELIISQEGLIPHLAKGFNTKAIVLFGQTSIKCFGYKENINIQGDTKCSNCWYSTDNWFKECPQKHFDCISMNSILPSKINSAISSVLS